MLKKTANVYVLCEADVRTIESALTGLRVALSAIITGRTVDPEADPAWCKGLSQFDRQVDDIMFEYDRDRRGHPDVF